MFYGYGKSLSLRGESAPKSINGPFPSISNSYVKSPEATYSHFTLHHGHDRGVTPGKVGKRGAAAGSARGGGEGLAAADGAHEASCDGGCSENEHQNIIMIYHDRDRNLNDVW